MKERLACGFPPHSPPHPVRDQTFYLLSATCYNHARNMGSPKRRQQVLDLCFEHFIVQGIEIRAWVALPNHYHLLVHITNFDALSDIFHLIHGSTSRQWNLEDKQGGRKVWFRFTDRAIRSERHYYTTLNYIHYNPVKHHCVQSPYEWTESSVHWYLNHFGRDWLRDIWMQCPVRDYGKGWDDI